MKQTLLARITLGAALVALTYSCSSPQADVDVVPDVPSANSLPAVIPSPNVVAEADIALPDFVSPAGGGSSAAPSSPVSGNLSTVSNSPVATAPVVNAPEPAADESLVKPEEVDSPTGQIRCRAVISASTETEDISVGLEFVYPQLRGREYLYVQVKPPTFDEETDFQKAWFHTAGEDSNWTVPNVMGIAPVDITLFAAARGPVNDRFVASFHSHPAVPVECAPL